MTSQQLIEQEVPRLVQLRLGVVEARIDAIIQLGRCAEAIAELGGLTVSYPLRERFQAQLMQAYSQAGQRAEALAAFRQARTIFAAELGAEPGLERQQLHQRILAGDVGLLIPFRPATTSVQPSSRRIWVISPAAPMR